MVLIGQTIASIAQIFLLGVSPNVAAVWFGADQVSLACSVGVFGNQVKTIILERDRLNFIINFLSLDRCVSWIFNTSDDSKRPR